VATLGVQEGREGRQISGMLSRNPAKGIKSRERASGGGARLYHEEKPPLSSDLPKLNEGRIECSVRSMGERANREVRSRGLGEVSCKHIGKKICPGRFKVESVGTARNRLGRRTPVSAGYCCGMSRAGGEEALSGKKESQEWPENSRRSLLRHKRKKSKSPGRRLHCCVIN